jgi:hypothetical protein
MNLSDIEELKTELLRTTPYTVVQINRVFELLPDPQIATDCLRECAAQGVTAPHICAKIAREILQAS